IFKFLRDKFGGDRYDRSRRYRSLDKQEAERWLHFARRTTEVVKVGEFNSATRTNDVDPFGWEISRNKRRRKQNHG
ncbi:MAG: hypothetical protein KDB27_19550, partial [Planctomycetales bacterium]|nr:hypothetical protein [Planctomycetales bacterium]